MNTKCYWGKRKKVSSNKAFRIHHTIQPYFTISESYAKEFNFFSIITILIGHEEIFKSPNCSIRFIEY